MKYSIITVTYNCADTIERTIQSVLNQNYKNYEYIIIDGASNDGTTETIRKYSDRLSYWISEPDEGIYSAMNKALEVSSGDLILFLGGDDYLADDNVLGAVTKEYVDQETIIIGRVQYGCKFTENMTGKDIKSPYFGVTYHHQGTFVPRKLYEKLKFFDESYKAAADFEWICRALYNNHTIKWIDIVVSVFRIGGVCASLEFLIDSYKISDKYMNMTNDQYLVDMRKQAIEYFRNYFYKKMCMDEKSISLFKDFFEKNGITDSVQLWGAGEWHPYYINVLRNCKISVDCIFDSDVRKKEFEGVQILPFDRDRASFVLISTEYYDDEIADSLNANGLFEKSGYIKFHSMRNNIIARLNEDDEELIRLKKQTGLEIL